MKNALQVEHTATKTGGVDTELGKTLRNENVQPREFRLLYKSTRLQFFLEDVVSCTSRAKESNDTKVKADNCAYTEYPY